MRFIVASVALLSCCSAARAERINIVGVVANYVTARDAVDIEIWLDRAPDLTREFVSFAGGNGRIDGVKFRITNHDDVPDNLNLRTYRAGDGSLRELVEMRDIPVQSRDAERDGIMRYVFSMSFTADTLRFDEFTPNSIGENRFAWAAAVQYSYGGGVEYDHANGWSTVDAPELIHSPEPSSLVLLGLAHLIWLPCLRQRFRERRVREANRVGG